MSNSFSYAVGTSNTPLKKETIGRNLELTVKQCPNHIALIDVQQDVRLTYQELWSLTTKVAKSLLHFGLKKGDRVGICAPNRFEWTVIQYATARVGVILVNLNPAYRKKEMGYVINHSQLKWMFTVETFKKSNYRKLLEKLEGNCPSLVRNLYMDTEWSSFLEAGVSVSDEALCEVEKEIHYLDPINLQYTSGTTGQPKGVTLTHYNILNNGYFIGQRLNYSEKDSVCIPVPLFHCFGMVIGNLACTSHGATMVYPCEAFDAEQTLMAVAKEKCTSLYGVPTMFITELQLLESKDYDLTSLRTGVMAGSPCPEEIMKKVKEKMYMSEISICYGMTETSPVSTQTKINVPLDKQVKTVGTVQDHIEIQIIDRETGVVLPINQEGEICTRGYSVMAGYWDNPDATADVIDADGWMHTGDLGVMDDEGYLVVSGRLKDLIIRGGENISPREVEEFLYTHTSIEDVQVIGVPDDKYGEELMAWVKIKEGADLSEEELRTFCKDQIAHFKTPRYWKFVNEFPMTVSGKVRKIEMKEIAIKELKR